MVPGMKRIANMKSVIYLKQLWYGANVVVQSCGSDRMMLEWSGIGINICMDMDMDMRI